MVMTVSVFKVQHHVGPKADCGVWPLHAIDQYLSHLPVVFGIDGRIGFADVDNERRNIP